MAGRSLYGAAKLSAVSGKKNHNLDAAPENFHFTVEKSAYVAFSVRCAIIGKFFLATRHKTHDFGG
jgi:hypothetical protein